MWLYLTIAAVLPICVFGSGGVSTTSDSNGCNYMKTNHMYFYSAKFKTQANIEDIDQCVLKCWKYKIGGTQICKAVNYIISEKSCEFLHQPFDVNNKILVQYYGFPDPNSIYAVPVSCPANDAVVTTTVGSEDTTSVATTVTSTGAASDAPSVPISDTSSTCGKTDIDPMASKRSLNRIVNGEEAKPHSIPWIISIRAGFTRRKHLCGATLISVGDPKESDIIITAAHCVINDFMEDNIELMAGGHNQQQTDGTQIIEYEEYAMHDKYDHPSKENDIAVVKLKEPFKFGPHVQPACLPAADEQVPDDKKGLVAGWGTIKEGVDKPYDILQQLPVPVVNSDKCKELFKNQNTPKFTNEKTSFCAGYIEGGKDSCQGDSGGPLFFKDAKGLYTLQGVVSYGKGCAQKDLAGVYARVSNYIPWINEQVKKLSEVAKKVNLRG